MPKSQIETKLEAEINTSLNKLKDLDPDSEEYGTIVERIVKLHKLKSEEGLKLPSTDTLLVVAANIFGILWIARYERENVITSKAFGIAIKPREIRS